MDQACKSGWGLILACSLPNNFCVKRNRFVDAFWVLDLQLDFFFFRTLVSTDTAILGHMYIKHREFQGCHAFAPWTYQFEEHAIWGHTLVANRHLFYQSGIHRLDGTASNERLFGPTANPASATTTRLYYSNHRWLKILIKAVTFEATSSA